MAILPCRPRGSGSLPNEIECFIERSLDAAARGDRKAFFAEWERHVRALRGNDMPVTPDMPVIPKAHRPG